MKAEEFDIWVVIGIVLIIGLVVFGVVTNP